MRNLLAHLYTLSVSRGQSLRLLGWPKFGRDRARFGRNRVTCKLGSEPSVVKVGQVCRFRELGAEEASRASVANACRRLPPPSLRYSVLPHPRAPRPRASASGAKRNVKKTTRFQTKAGGVRTSLGGFRFRVCRSWSNVVDWIVSGQSSTELV